MCKGIITLSTKVEEEEENFGLNGEKGPDWRIEIKNFVKLLDESYVM